MTVTVSRFDERAIAIFRNLYPLYRHDLSRFADNAWPNAHGVLEVDEAVRDLAAQADAVQRAWLEDPALLPFLIRANGHPAGFCLVAIAPDGSSGTGAPLGAEYLVQEFFLLHFARGQGVGYRAAQMIVEQLPGRWRLYVMPRNAPARRFWRGALAPYAPEEFDGLDPDGDPAVVFRFRSPSQLSEPSPA